MPTDTQDNWAAPAVPASDPACTAAVRLIARLGLVPHPEGGYYRESYRANERIRRLDGAERSASTAIYYLLCGDAFSAWHRIDTDEIWHFYAGDALDVHVLEDGGRLTTYRLGNALSDERCVFQASVPAGRWFAAERIDSCGYALVGCTVAPGFEFSEFELADARRLEVTHARHAALIQRLASRPDRAGTAV